MAVTSTIEYCTDRDLQDVYPNVSAFDLKRRIYNWQTTGTTHLYLVRNSGLVTQLFADGEDLGSAEANSGVVNANGEWYYDSDLDTVYYYDSATAPNSRTMEAGDDWTTIKQRFRRKASRLLESKINYRLSAEISKDREGNYPEIIVHASALLTIMLLIKAHDPNNEILESLKEEFDEIREGLLSGTITLPTSVTGDSSRGIIREVSVNGATTLRPVQLKGTYSGNDYDLLKVYIDTGEGGAIGTAKMTVKGSNTDKLKENIIIDSEVITGRFQALTSGLYIRWSAAVIDGSTDVATQGDEYEIEVWGSSVSTDVSQVGSISLTRR
tara:strand:- start:299 stop:1276 length:978 start_codon:yes stop_codon:yes gene_type:complete